jgi:hypothetical protein
MRTLVILGIIVASCAAALAHSGRTDGAGGHFNRRTGGYHYHHGHGPHDHPNGECPYQQSFQQSSRRPYSFTPIDRSGEYARENAIAAAVGLLAALGRRWYRRQ